MSELLATFADPWKGVDTIAVGGAATIAGPQRRAAEVRWPRRLAANATAEKTQMSARRPTFLHVRRANPNRRCPRSPMWTRALRQKGNQDARAGRCRLVRCDPTRPQMCAFAMSGARRASADIRDGAVGDELDRETAGARASREEPQMCAPVG